MPRSSHCFIVASLTAALVACAEEGDIDVKSPEATIAPASRAPHLTPRAPGIAVHTRIGSPNDDEMGPAGPGVVLFGGGTIVDSAFRWAQSTIGGTRGASAGDVVVISLTDDGGAFANHIADAAAFNSVQTIIVSPTATADELGEVANVLERAEIVVLAIDDASQLLRWRETQLVHGVQQAFDRGGVIVGVGDSAGALGEFAHDTSTDSDSIETTDALANPYEKTMTFARDTFKFPLLEGTIVDTHFRENDRFGRLAAFMARQVADGTLATHPARAFGVGVDENNALVIDRFGRATLHQNEGANGGAYVLAGGTPEQIFPDAQLVYGNLAVARMDSPGEGFDLRRGCGTAFAYHAAITGVIAAKYDPANPYEAAGVAHDCDR